ncbi:hypothetical protein B9479_002446 [Cryptococcus floricola]|uniref:Uncharacterized protein n=1 Tax=Cryptococcus floricola TaxID=2591691 RepID=A0A5D3B3K6_9TREE|nr:hypothetical protein B9479_002446 [Cryptococcus floricola]
MSQSLSYYTEQSWTADDLTADELPKAQSTSLGGVETIEFEDDFSRWPSTGQPGPLTTAFVLVGSQYDPETKKLTRTSVTAARMFGEDDPPDVYTDVIDAANKVDETVWNRLVKRSENKDGEGWFESCLTTDSVEPLFKEQSRLAKEIQTDHPGVEMVPIESDYFEKLPK